MMKGLFAIASLFSWTVSSDSNNLHKSEKIICQIPIEREKDSANTSSAQIPPDRFFFVNDICLPARLYMLSGVENNIFVEPLLKRWRPYDDVVRFSGSTIFQRRLARVASINAPKQGATVAVSLINTDHFDTVKTITSTIIVGQQGVGTDSIAVSIIGDSFTNGSFFKDALLAKGYVPKLQLIGLRDVAGYPGQSDEGRGGWTLANYFSVSNQRTQSYNGFWQPDGAYRYWGATEFWQLANAVRREPGRDWTFAEKYFAGRFTTQSLRFDQQTGYKLDPMINDIMYDNALGYYMRYNGKKWIRTAYEDFTWHFDYGKYLAMWKLKAPSILAEFLGLNDFRSEPVPQKIDFSTWNEKIKTVIASYLKAVPDGKFIIMIPSSTCGTLDNAAGDFTIKQNATMWELRQNIIKNFDGREKEHIYIVDAAIAIDNLNGFNVTADTTMTKPYSQYAGNEHIVVQTGNPHPYPNYPGMGLSLAAFIQTCR
ncbi:hypothetical protein [Chitinophaga sp. MM2321]|uniref:hypothetical protein n=1 Tax=Chitinophaga sp. MM2321 TaxID=3137178 RepID=UPI0032D58AFB